MCVGDSRKTREAVGWEGDREEAVGGEAMEGDRALTPSTRFGVS